MPMLRYEFYEFVRMWNGHHIRSQVRRPHVIPGVPFMLYNQPNPELYVDCRVPLDRERWRLLMDRFELDTMDIEHYLPKNTFHVCETIVQDFGGIPEELQNGDDKHPYLQEYEKLRSALQTHINLNMSPALGLLPKPHWNKQEMENILQNDGIQIGIDEIEINSDNEIDL
jgi:hypothetical protein